MAPYAAMSLGGFLGTLLILVLILWKADRLAAFGLTGIFYYVALIPLALMVAAFLFGALKSVAVYRGHAFGGKLELRGPFVGSVIVLILGFVLPQPMSNFPFTVYVHGPSGLSELIVKNLGCVLLDLGPQRLCEKIRERGEAFFPQIPASFRGQEVRIGIDAPGYELVQWEQTVLLEGAATYLAVRRKSGHIAGHVQDERGRPVVGARIMVAGLMVSTDAAGHFELLVPGDQVKPELPLHIVAGGYATWRGSVVPDANEVIVTLQRLN